MKNKKIVGLVLIVLGFALALWGYDVYDSAGSKLGRAIGGDTPIEAFIGLGSGVVCIILGILRIK